MYKLGRPWSISRRITATKIATELKHCIYFVYVLTYIHTYIVPTSILKYNLFLTYIPAIYETIALITRKLNNVDYT